HRRGGPGAGRFRRAERASSPRAPGPSRRSRRRPRPAGTRARRGHRANEGRLTNMQIAIIGLGRMGGNIARRLMRHGHEVVVYDANRAAIDTLAKEHATPSSGLKDLVAKLKAPRALWVMLPAGKITEETIAALAPLLQSGDTIIDGGNSFYRDDIRRARELKPRGIHYVDCGTSGGVWGLERGYCMMIGGDKEVVSRLDPIFAALAPGEGTIEKTPGREGRDPRAEQGYLHAGPPGAGHFVKMVHNGIEYGMMQAYAEGFDILRGKKSEELPEDERFTLDLPDVAEVWRRGSVISSWLLDLSAMALAGSPQLKEYSGTVADSGEGRWTIDAAIEEAVPANVLSAALYARFRSRIEGGFADKLLSAMRHGFGGHIEPPTAGSEK
ncbi:MAG: phosphogluconate dehydrogenase (NAD(+)-dependent, decarboxylating), partial [Stellaceae bacterium]